MKLKKKTPYNVQVDPRLIELAKKSGADVPEAVRQFIDKLAHAEVCPACNQLKRRK